MLCLILFFTSSRTQIIFGADTKDICVFFLFSLTEHNTGKQHSDQWRGPKSKEQLWLLCLQSLLWAACSTESKSPLMDVVHELTVGRSEPVCKTQTQMQAVDSKSTTISRLGVTPNTCNRISSVIIVKVSLLGHCVIYTRWPLYYVHPASTGRTHFSFRTVLALRVSDSPRCWKHSSGILHPRCESPISHTPKVLCWIGMWWL